MAGRRRRWLWLLLLLVLILGTLWHSERQRNNQLAHRVASSAVENKFEIPQTRADLSVQPQRRPSYISVKEARLQDYERNAMFVLIGKVTSEQGGPLPGAVVSLHSSKGEWPRYEWPTPLISQTCDNEGRYTIRLRSPMHAYVLVRKEGFTQKEAQIDFVVPETIEMDHRLLPAPACAEGYVLDQAGAPIPGARVSLAMGDVVMATLHSTFSPIFTTADVTGKYLLRGLPEGNGNLWVFSERHLPGDTAIKLKTKDCQRVDFHLAEGLPLSFSVKNARGKAVPSPRAFAPGHASDEAYFATGDEEGVVQLAIPPDLGPFDCTVDAVGYKNKITRVDPQAPPSVIVLEDAEVSPKEVFKGRVVDETGMPVEGAKLDGGGGVAGTDKDGRFSIVGSSGTLSGSKFKVSKPGYIPQVVIPGFIEQPGGRLDSETPNAEVIISLKRGEGGIYGRAVDEAGKPVKRFHMILTTETWTVYHRDFDNDDGLFSVVDVPAGIYDISFTSLPINDRKPFLIERLLLKRIEIRRGYYYGEIVAQLLPNRAQ